MNQYPTGCCGFCGASGYASCREFLSDVPNHPERPKASLFIRELDGPTVEAVDTLFAEELEGITAETVDLAQQLQQEADQAEDECRAEMAIERAYETNDQYRWEVEEDERRASFFGGF
jgi:hypothetical protein